MDWSDDVAYSVHDLEDGLHAGHLQLDQLRDALERVEIVKLAAASYSEASEAELEETATELFALACWPASYDGSLRGLAGLKNLTSQLIGRFTQAAEAATREAYGRAPLTRYAADLIVPRQTRLECALLKAVTARYVMARSGVAAVQERQRELMTELVELLSCTAPQSLEAAFRSAFTEADDDAQRLRVVVDQVASLTDSSAVAWHHRLRGTLAARDV